MLAGAQYVGTIDLLSNVFRGDPNILAAEYSQQYLVSLTERRWPATLEKMKKLKFALASILDWIDVHVLHHCFHPWFCSFVMNLYPDEDQ